MIEHPASSLHALLERRNVTERVLARRTALAAIGALGRHAAIMAAWLQGVPEDIGIASRRLNSAGQTSSDARIRFLMRGSASKLLLLIR